MKALLIALSLFGVLVYVVLWFKEKIENRKKDYAYKIVDNAKLMDIIRDRGGVK